MAAIASRWAETAGLIGAPLGPPFTVALIKARLPGPGSSNISKASTEAPRPVMSSMQVVPVRQVDRVAQVNRHGAPGNGLGAHVQRAQV